MSDDEKKFRSKLYTKTGDKGTSALYNGERRPKNDTFFHSLGSIDELSACIGVALEYCLIDKNGLEPYLERIVGVMLDIGACIATPLDNSQEKHIKKTKLDDRKYVETLERWIDTIDSQLPPLKFFIIPCNVGLASSHLHVARSFSLVPEVVGIFINRLSDFLFAAARFAAMKSGKDEAYWTSKGVTFDDI
ncbi:hypothetical protein DDB_G0281875 [Dictyostelium discoideum AX4]|uniref:Cobalamin adenosyltransferase-like domain-containing protein n=1 Tax=Dictyostelium discoideum TaxID=44689 RepID=Q54TB6_DICDI|nr:hypothetical protein DDB_G0281875 [Dictyostelium discoideum AX4]EAL66497.1 hypothetical protein DDB_G0281875 [Dictyostelium discoideum AX4]|eukprot:XP_640473.1 hypothetical protein DDB_G0281875 [Dictyostelium discoideum AX4]